ncbi:hypothetical protein LINPERHAP1_LOCUS36664, partial [Linum perenne]
RTESSLWLLFSDSKEAAPKRLNSTTIRIHRSDDDTSFFKKFNPAQRKTLVVFRAEMNCSGIKIRKGFDCWGRP